MDAEVTTTINSAAIAKRAFAFADHPTVCVDGDLYAVCGDGIKLKWNGEREGDGKGTGATSRRSSGSRPELGEVHPIASVDLHARWLEHDPDVHRHARLRAGTSRVRWRSTRVALDSGP